MVVVVILHYATAIHGFWEINPLMNWVLLTSPIAFACLYWIWFKPPSRLWVLLSTAVAMLILFALGSDWIRWFSKDPYEYYILVNHYFGPLGWHQWLWAITTGLLPLAFVSRFVSERVPFRRMLVALILIGYLDNLIVVIRACHL